VRDRARSAKRVGENGIGSGNGRVPMNRRFRIGIATGGRFHVLDLARELHALGHEVKFYSYVSRARARAFGLPEECHVSLLPFVLPAVVWERLAFRITPGVRERLLCATLDCAVMMRLQPCDVLICMSGIYLETARFAKRHFGARIWLERGSRHILSQDEILAAIPGSKRPSRFIIRRELAGYALADRISIPSAQVEESFHRDNSIRAKLVRNPYGVDLRMFPLRALKPVGEPVTFLTVGHWSLQKGCDILVAAAARVPGTRLVHVGEIVDLAFPQHNDRFVHIGSVPQPRLASIYAEADAFVLASRQDGFGMVLSQALASGLPVICTDRTGGADLAHTPALAARITIVSHGSVDALASAMAEKLSWGRYAQRYSEALQCDFAKAQAKPTALTE
jgi:alpha-maltose-1-phosphate synthase